MSNALHVVDFINPNKGNTAFSIRPKLEQYKQYYFEKVAKDLLVSATYNERKDRWCFFFKFPSGENDKYPTAIMYDILIEFNPISKSNKDLTSLDQYDIYIYSNSPSFVFTFDYVIKHKIGFPKILPNNYLSKVAISKAPRIRNTYEIMTVEKTTWICFWHLYRNGYLNKNMAKTLINKEKDENFYIKNMDTQPQKLQEIKQMQDLLKQEKLADKVAKQTKQLAKSYSSNSSIDTDNPLSVGNKLTFKSGLNKINQLKFLSHIEKKNELKTKNMFKADNLKVKKW